ncbi:MAG: ferrous iron transport protein A [Clostridia bacterium]|nr:ferrous iron transport protein A [Clostridia bacterium]MBQ8511461.1 ferrous iron transport protein A [Clostridia bacterium]
MKLSQLRPGECGVVTGIQQGSLTRRLRDLGLTDGTAVTCMLRSPLGDPCAYAFRGSVIAMRKKDADTVGVEYHGT